MLMGDMLTRFGWREARNFFGVRYVMRLGVICVCSLEAAPALAQVVVPTHKTDSAARLLSIDEGRSIVDVAWQQDAPEADMQDCSHAVHQIYATAGYEYPYASSFQIYAGAEAFERVKNPHAGDLIAWPGHVGIVVDPLQHSFYSLVRAGMESQDYESAYWRSRGRPRFYRYKVESGGVVTATNRAGASRDPYGPARRVTETAVEERTMVASRPSNRPQKSPAIYGPPAPPEWPGSKNAEAALEIPASVIVAAGSKPPTREEVAEGISKLSGALGTTLWTDDDPLKNQRPIVIVEQFNVERIDVKRDRGWARLVIDSRVFTGGGATLLKRRREKIQWELRRTESGWEAVPPTDRTYVPHDVAVKNLAANLARLANSDGAAKHELAVLRQESELAGLLNALLESSVR